MGQDLGRFREAERRYWATLGATPEERWVDVPALGTPVRLQVVGDGPPLVFVHGTQNAGTSWAALAARLPGHRCLLLDRPGCGLSPPLTRRTADVAAFAALAETLVVDVLDGLGLDRATVVGTSLGGYHVLRTAAAHAERLERAVLLGWSVGVPNEHLPLLLRLAGVRSLARLMSRVPVTDRTTVALTKRIGVRLPPEGISWYRDLLNHTDTRRNELDAAPALIDLRRGFHPALLFTDELLARITVPVHFVWGADDPFGGADVAAAFAPRVPGATLEIVPGGHAVWMDDPDRIAAAVASGG